MHFIMSYAWCSIDIGTTTIKIIKLPMHRFPSVLSNQSRVLNESLFALIYLSSQGPIRRQNAITTHADSNVQVGFVLRERERERVGMSGLNFDPREKKFKSKSEPLQLELTDLGRLDVDRSNKEMHTFFLFLLIENMEEDIVGIFRMLYGHDHKAVWLSGRTINIE